MMSRKKTGWNDDHYTKKARDGAFKARSVFKLEELDRKFGLFRKGDTVLDLGCAPGSWLQYVLTRIGPAGRATGIDLQETSIPGAECIRADIFSFPLETLPPCNAVISDMAPATSGQPFVDAQRSLELCRSAFTAAERLLKPGGAFVCKIFQGEDLDTFFRELKPRFTALHRLKPESSREKSREIFIVGTGFKQGPTSPAQGLG